MNKTEFDLDTIVSELDELTSESNVESVFLEVGVLGNTSGDWMTAETTTEERVSRAKELVSEKRTSSEERQALAKTLMRAKMTHPITGRQVSQTYFAESLCYHGVTLMDWIRANYVSREEHETALARQSNAPHE